MSSLFSAAAAGIMFAAAGHSQPVLARPAFEVASIKRHAGIGRSGITVTPGRFSVENLPVRRLIFNAYKVTDFQISAAPGWVDSETYDIDAKAETRFSGTDMLLMLQTLLEDKFRLKVHRETKEGPVYELSIAKNGVKLQPTKAEVALYST